MFNVNVEEIFLNTYFNDSYYFPADFSVNYIILFVSEANCFSYVYVILYGMRFIINQLSDEGSPYFCFE